MGDPRTRDRRHGDSILVIDRQIEVGDLLRDALVARGYRVKVAYDLDSAVACLSPGQCSLVILCNMATVYRRGDRWPILEMIKDLAGAHVPVIVLTGNPVALKQGIEKLGVADLIAKPFELDDLMKRVTNVLGQHP